ncbi:hypothetical protein [Lysinibacillus sp. LZ02]|uniref:hypothetical protein n=1 Tax=Lysinibacillus sp. LZ02 TaxID=3420668 RepID=UPI003D361CCF
MFITLGILIISGFIIYMILPKLLKDGDRKTIWVFSLLLFIGTALNMALSLNVKIPSPLDVIIVIFKPISEFLKVAFLK